MALGSYYTANPLTKTPKSTRPECGTKKRDAVDYSMDDEVVICDLLIDLTPLSVLMFPHRHAVEDDSRRPLLYCDASTDGFGTTLDQAQSDGRIRPTCGPKPVRSRQR